MWTPGNRIPTNIITGVLGAGKTTVIQHLITQRPKHERWAILINEYGHVSLDHIMADPNNEHVFIEDIAGGCACCSLAFAFVPLLAQFLRRTKPDRLIIEPSSVGHLAGMADCLRGDNFRSVIDLRATICVIDPKDLTIPRVSESQLFSDQLQLADIVAISWGDKREPELVNRCHQFVERLEPPKRRIERISHGELPLDTLDHFDDLEKTIRERDDLSNRQGNSQRS